MPAPTHIKAIRLGEKASIDELTLDDLPFAEPGPGEILVRIRAASLNYRDVLIASGRYGEKPDEPRILGSDGAGDVVAVGAGVTRFERGDRVAGTFFQCWDAGDPTEAVFTSALGGAIDGVFATYKIFREGGVVRIPDHLSFEEASTLPCAALTAWQALFARARIGPGDTVLALGTGGVSIFALQFGSSAGAEVIVTSSSDEKLERARALGATRTINYRTTPEWDREVRRLTGGRGVDAVIEVGGEGTFERSVRSARMGGHVAAIGNLSGFDVQLKLRDAVANQVNIHGVYVGSRSMFEDMNRAIAATRLRPAIDRVYEFEHWRQAIADLEKGEHFGKLVIRFA